MGRWTEIALSLLLPLWGVYLEQASWGCSISVKHIV